MDVEYDHNASWYDITVEEEERMEKENIVQQPNTKSQLSPLKEHPQESLLSEVFGTKPVTPTRSDARSRLGPRAERAESRLGQRGSLRHVSADTLNHKRNYSPSRDYSPARQVNKKVKTSRGTPTHTTPTHGTPTPSTPTRGTPTTPTRGTPTRGTPTRGTPESRGMRGGSEATRTPSSKSHTPSSKSTTPSNKSHTPSSTTPLTKEGGFTPADYRTPGGASGKRTLRTPNTDSRLCVKGKALNFEEGSKRADSELSSVVLTDNQIAQREKQVTYGKVTEGYQNYKAIIPKSLRLLKDPSTPPKNHPYSKRCWDGLVRAWRKRLHHWDDPVVGLKYRAVYSRKNKDLKKAGLITDEGEVVMFTQYIQSEVTSIKPEIKEEYSITQCPSFTLKTEPAEPVTVKTEPLDTVQCDPVSSNQWQDSEWLKTNLAELDDYLIGESQDSATLIKSELQDSECEDTDSLFEEMESEGYGDRVL